MLANITKYTSEIQSYDPPIWLLGDDNKYRTDKGTHTFNIEEQINYISNL